MASLKSLSRFLDTSVGLEKTLRLIQAVVTIVGYYTFDAALRAKCHMARGQFAVGKKSLRNLRLRGLWITSSKQVLNEYLTMSRTEMVSLYQIYRQFPTRVRLLHCAEVESESDSRGSQVEFHGLLLVS